MKLTATFKKCLTNFYWGEDERGRKIKIPITDLSVMWAKISEICDGRLNRLGKIPFFVQDTGEIKMIASPSELFGFLFSREATIMWSDKPTGAISKSEMFQYVGVVAKNYDMITALPHYPKMPGCFYSKQVEPAETQTLDTLINMMNYATDADRQLLKAMFMTPFWGGKGGSRPAFLIDGLDNDPLGNRGIGKTSITDVLAHLCGDCVDISNKTDGEDIKKRLLTCGDVRLVRMDNIKTSSLSNDVLESLITIKKVSGHKMYAGHAAISNWFTYVMTFNDAALSRDMAQRTIVIRLKRPEYSSSWYDDVCDFIDNNKDKLISEIGFLLKKDTRGNYAKMRFPAWARDVLGKACDNVQDVLAHIVEEQKKTDSESQLADTIREVMVSKISKLWRINHGSSEKVYFDPSKDVLAFKRSVIFEWISPLFGREVSRKYIGQKFHSAGVSEFYFEPKIYLGDYYLIWRGGASSNTSGTPGSCWRIVYENSVTRVEEWEFKNLGVQYDTPKDV